MEASTAQGEMKSWGGGRDFCELSKSGETSGYESWDREWRIVSGYFVVDSREPTVGGEDPTPSTP